MQIAVCTLALTASAAAHDPPAIADPACSQLSVTAVPRGGREFAARIVNSDRGDFPATIDAAIGVETEVHGHWRAVSVAGLLARATCAERPGDTVTLAPRASLTAAPWTGMIGDAQCDCEECGPAPAGRYRFVVRIHQGCVGAHESYSAPFALHAAH